MVETQKTDKKTNLNQELQDLMISQYAYLYRVSKIFTHKLLGQACELELLAEFDTVSGNFEQFKGWIEADRKEKGDSRDRMYGEVILKPLRRGSLIYHFNGTIEWTSFGHPYDLTARDICLNLSERLIPISAKPIYDPESGRIIQLQPSDLGDSQILEKATIEYLELRIK